MRQEMSQSGARRPGGLVEVDRPLLESDEDRQPGQELRHRRPREHALRVAVLRRDPPRDAGSRTRLPAVDEPQRVHAGDTRNVERPLVPAISPFADMVGYSRAVRAGNTVYVAGTAPV